MCVRVICSFPGGIDAIIGDSHFIPGTVDEVVVDEVVADDIMADEVAAVDAMMADDREFAAEDGVSANVDTPEAVSKVAVEEVMAENDPADGTKHNMATAGTEIDSEGI